MTNNSVPKFESVSEAEAFFETHDLAGYFDEMPIVRCDFNIQKSARLVPVAAELAQQLAQLAKKQNTTTENLVDILLREHLAEAA